MAEPDISRVIGLILENPALVEQIKNLVAEGAPTDGAAASEAVSEAVSEDEVADAAPVSVPIAETPRHRRGRRTELIEALKPYISAERQRAIESFITIADILELMRAK